MNNKWCVESDYKSTSVSLILSVYMIPTRVVDFCDSEDEARLRAEALRERAGYSNVRILQP